MAPRTLIARSRVGATLPRDPSIDATFAFFREGYPWMGRRGEQLGTDLFRTRLMGRPVVCTFGEEVARRFTRRGAMPQTTLRLLQNKGSVQMLDGAAHAARKAMFMGMMTPGAIAAMGDAFDRRWAAELDGAAGTTASLHLLAGRALSGAACDWAGIAVDGQPLAARTREFLAMIDGAGSVGPRAWKGLALRRRAERWARERIGAARAEPDTGTPLARLAHHRAPDGALLSQAHAAIELLNLLRPTVAVARFVAFAGLALNRHPEWRTRVADREEALRFVQEMRRFFPFFPVIGGRVRRAFTWRGHDFAPGEWVLLGLHATNHDPRLWPDPHLFAPDRFHGWHSSGFDLIPQGAGDYRSDHRCPGEWNTVEVTVSAVQTRRCRAPACRCGWDEATHTAVLPNSCRVTGWLDDSPPSTAIAWPLR